MWIWIHTWIHVYEFIYMKSYIWIHAQTLLCTPEIICFFHEFIREFMIFHKFMHELRVWIHMQTHLGNPNSWFFMNSCQISWISALFIEEIIHKFIAEEYCEEYCEKYSDFVEVLKKNLDWIHRRRATASSCSGLATAGSGCAAAPDQFKISLVTSVQVHVWVRALPIVLSESLYMTSLRHS